MQPAQQITPENLRAYLNAANNQYRHMSEDDVAVWEQFLRSTKAPKATWLYDVKVGQWAEPTYCPEIPNRPLYADLLAKRIDAVGITPEKTIIVEVKPRLTMAAIGQALTYADLWQRTWPNTPAPTPAIVYAITDPDIEPVAKRYGITLYHVEGAEHPETQT